MEMTDEPAAPTYARECDLRGKVRRIATGLSQHGSLDAGNPLPAMQVAYDALGALLRDAAAEGRAAQLLPRKG
jgi:hypothetical protein